MVVNMVVYEYWGNYGIGDEFVRYMSRLGFTFFIHCHTIVAGCYGFTLGVHVSVCLSICHMPISLCIFFFFFLFCFFCCCFFPDDNLSISTWCVH